MSDYLVSTTDNAVLVTAFEERISGAEKQILLSAIEKYSSKTQQSSVFPNDDTNTNALTFDYIDELANGIQTNLTNQINANAAIRQQVIVNPLLGRAYDCIMSNVNTNYSLAYPKATDEISEEDIAEAKGIIEQFNEDTDLRELIREAVGLTCLEGNYSMVLRITKDHAIIDHYPLSFVYPSDYEANRETILEFSVKTLKDKLRKTYSKNKKNKAIYYENIEKEILANYPGEVGKAYKAGENIVRLDPNYTGCVKIGNMGRKFGVSIFLKCLKPLVVLNNIENADVASSKARTKKIIFQKLRKELLGDKGTNKAFAEQAHAHSQAVSALNTNFGLYTAPAYVESLEYVVDNSGMGDKDAIATYNSKMLTALGIGFADTNVANYSVANISVDQLMKIIDSIVQQVERIINRFYKMILELNGKDSRLAPKLNVHKSEQLSWELRKDIASFLYQTLNGSNTTALEYIGVDADEELRRRKAENESGYGDVFYPRATSYTVAGNPNGEGDSDTEKPEAKDEEKQLKDKDYNKTARS